MTQMELFEQNQKLVYRVYSDKIKNKAEALPIKEDILQEGLHALWKACQKFDETRGVKFITYAYKSIENSMKVYLYRQKEKVKLMVSISAKIEDTPFSYEECLPTRTDMQEFIEIHDILDQVSQQLDARSLLVIKMIKEGYTQSEIGKELQIHQVTVHRTIELIKQKILKIITYKEKTL